MYIDGRNERYSSSETHSQSYIFFTFGNLMDDCFYHLLKHYETMLDKLTTIHGEIDATYAVQEDMEFGPSAITTRSCSLLACNVKQAKAASCRLEIDLIKRCLLATTQAFRCGYLDSSYQMKDDGWKTYSVKEYIIIITYYFFC